MRNRKILLVAAVMLTCLLNAGCGLRIGPEVKETYTILHPGRPMEVLKNAKVTGRLIDGTGQAVTQDVGGWVMMPPEHWAAIRRALEKEKAE